MMGKTHALTGLAGGMLGAYLAHVGIGEGIAGVALCAGAAILPDIDHPRSTVSNVYGPLTRGFCWIMTKLTGGHRRGTHSLPGIFALGVVAQGGVTYRETIPGMVALSLIMILCLAGGIRLLKISGWIDDVLPIPVVIGVVCFTTVPLTWVPIAVMLGCVIHVAGDMVTKTGCPLLWPFSQTNTKLGLFKTNGITERYVVTPLTIAVIIGMFVWMFYSGVDWGHMRM
jgi:membrane-bound metal-dependent hydrolase YbcI (DUF457 family)